MTVRKLIEVLKRCDQDLEVVHIGSEWEMDVDCAIIGRREPTAEVKVHLSIDCDTDAHYPIIPDGKVITPDA